MCKFVAKIRNKIRIGKGIYFLFEKRTKSDENNNTNKTIF